MWRGVIARTDLSKQSDEHLRSTVRGLIYGWIGANLIAGGLFAFVVAYIVDRAEVLENGRRVTATVTGERYGESRYGEVLCSMIYTYQAAGKTYEGEARFCLPFPSAGRKLDIAYDPADPAKSVSFKEGATRGETVRIVALALPLPIIALLTLGPAFSRFRELRRRERQSL
jgi:hypothetical protein